MRCTKLLKVFILYLLSFEGRFLSKIKPFITVLLIKKLPLKKLIFSIGFFDKKSIFFPPNPTTLGI